MGHGYCVAIRTTCGNRVPIEDVSTPDPDPMGPVRYSCANWVDHLENSYPAPNNHDLVEGGLVNRFLQERYLYWLEALSLMRIIPHGVLAVRKLDNI